MFCLEILLKRGKQLIATRGFFRGTFWIRKGDRFTEVAPEIIFYQTHFFRIWSKHLLGLLDLFAIFFRNVFQISGKICGGHGELLKIVGAMMSIQR